MIVVLIENTILIDTHHMHNQISLFRQPCILDAPKINYLAQVNHSQKKGANLLCYNYYCLSQFPRAKNSFYFSFICLKWKNFNFTILLFVGQILAFHAVLTIL